MSDDLDPRSVSLSRGIPAGKRLATPVGHAKTPRYEADFGLLRCQVDGSQCHRH